MKKTIIVAAVAFVVALAAGVGGRIALAPPPAPVDAAEVPGADAKASMAGDTDPMAAAAHGAEDAHGMSPEQVAEHVESALDQAVAAGDHGSATTPDGVPIASVEFQEISRVMSSIEAPEASMFLTHLDDDRVLGILRSMNVRQVRAILDHFPETRAEVLRRRLLEHQPGDK